MIPLVFILGLSQIFVGNSYGYVLVQVRKQDANHSNVDALIHKVVPSRNLDKFTENIARKHFQRDHSTELVNEKNEIPQNGGKINGSNDVLNIKDLIKMAIRKLTGYDAGPVFKANSGEHTYLSKPEKIDFGKGISTVFSLTPEAISRIFEDALSSKSLRIYLDALSKKAAMLFRAIEDNYMSY